eukprot:763819-Hanusia_phi.AAC.3
MPCSPPPPPIQSLPPLDPRFHTADLLCTAKRGRAGEGQEANDGIQQQDPRCCPACPVLCSCSSTQPDLLRTWREQAGVGSKEAAGAAPARWRSAYRTERVACGGRRDAEEGTCGQSCHEQ